MPEPLDLARRFDRLSPDAQAAALVYGVVHPHDCTCSQVVQILRHAEIQAHGKRLTNARVHDADRELVEAGLAYVPGRGAGLRASSHWAPWLTMRAHRAGVLDRIVAGHGRACPRLSFYDGGARTAMALRCSTVAGRFDHINGAAVEPYQWGFLAEPRRCRMSSRARVVFPTWRAPSSATTGFSRSKRVSLRRRVLRGTVTMPAS